jgi:hypothetical protein
MTHSNPSNPERDLYSTPPERGVPASRTDRTYTDNAYNANPVNPANGRPATPEEVAYRNGYTEAKARERNRPVYSTTRVEREDSAATGVIVGILLAGIVGLIGGIAYWLSQSDTNNPFTSPQPATTETNPNVIERDTTIIERNTVDRTQEITPSQPPNVQITVPSTQNDTAAPAPPAESPATDISPDATGTNGATTASPTEPQSAPADSTAAE